MENDDWLNEILAKIESQKEEEVVENPPLGEEKVEEKTEGVGEVITLVEHDEESGAMFQRQQQYEMELENYAPDDPRRVFQHNFLRSQYLPVLMVEGKATKEYTVEEVAEEISETAYYLTPKGIKKLNHMTFCRIWHERFLYEYCAGNVITPDGAIDADQFKSEITKMLFNIDIEITNIDATVSHIFSTYIMAYSTDVYMRNDIIPFRNGDLVLNPDKKGFTFYIGRRSPFPYRFDYDFKNVPNCLEPDFPNFKSWLDGLFEIEDQYTIKQMLGYLLIPDNSAQEAFFVVGKGGSGKSILTDCIIPKMLGKAAFPISIGTFFNDKFQVASSVGKLCMFDDDIGEANLSKADSGRFKNFITARTIQIEQKFCNPTRAHNSARIVCSGNHMINSDDKTDGFTRRLHPIYAKPRTIDKADRLFPKKIEKEIELIVLWALEGLLEMEQFGIVPHRSDKTNVNFEYYAESQKWEEQFISDCFCYKEKTVTYMSDIKEALQDWMKDNSEICGDRTLAQNFYRISRWLHDEGADKNGYVYKRGIRRGDNYNNRGYVNMSLKRDVTSADVFTDEKGSLKVRVKRKKPEDQETFDNEKN